MPTRRPSRLSDESVTAPVSLTRRLGGQREPTYPPRRPLRDRRDRDPGQRQRPDPQLRRAVRLGRPPPPGRLAGHVLARRDRHLPGHRRAVPVRGLPGWLARPPARLALGHRPDRPERKRRREYRPHPARARPPRHLADRLTAATNPLAAFA